MDHFGGFTDKVTLFAKTFSCRSEIYFPNRILRRHSSLKGMAIIVKEYTNLKL